MVNFFILRYNVLYDIEKLLLVMIIAIVIVFGFFMFMLYEFLKLFRFLKN